MKIRTRLLLFLLPATIGCILLIASILSFNWYKEIIGNFKLRLKAAVISSSLLFEPKNAQFNPSQLPKIFNELKKTLEITSLSLVHFDRDEAIIFHTTANGSFSMEKKHKNSFLKPGFTDNKIFISSFHKDPFSENKIITGRAPIFDTNSNLNAMIIADISAGLLEKKLQSGLLIIIISALVTIIFITITLFLIANKISLPVQKLNNSALSIAAGNYENFIKIKGPKEIATLANTLNTMGECLQDNINRLKEDSLLHEKMYGKYESAILLQKYMLQKAIEENKSDLISTKVISLFSNNPRGLLCDFPETLPHLVKINLVEAKGQGFEGMYELLTNYQLFKEGKRLKSPFLKLEIDSYKSIMTCQCNAFYYPLIWSLSQKKLIIASSKQVNIEPGDFFFLANNGINYFFPDLPILITKVMKFFAEDGLETCYNMLKKEITFATKTKELENDIHLICFQILY
jgi:HAMP domain-containing protein